jgi:ribose transport system substrate-binding protein
MVKEENRAAEINAADRSDAPGGVSRRGFLGAAAGAGVSLTALLAACGGSTPAASSGSGGLGVPPNTKRLKAAFSNNSLTATWCAQGKQVAETWGKWFGVDVTWYDGGGSVDVQRKAVEDMAAKKWDFVALQAVGVDTLNAPVQQLIDSGIPVIQMDTEISSKSDLAITSFLSADNVAMGELSSTALFEKMGGKGTVIMTQGQLGHTGAQLRAQGFQQALAKFPNIKMIADDPGNWDVNLTTQLWENYLVKYKDIGGGFFHNDDMALAASKVIQNAGRTIPVSGIDAMPPAIQAVLNGSMAATVRNPSGRVHWGALMVGILASNGVKNIPTYILTDGPVASTTNGPGLIFMENEFLL